ncbi:unnamed protein product [Rhizoctonia solani]|uniref:Peptidase C14 caspase domain-containing protein n=1 Tax=Rhizoctonia solani TaxID=456999 RepID=A0A8H3A7X8_9AGAM|nr:unnamed protein product [Rhizoctonia solani]
MLGESEPLVIPEGALLIGPYGAMFGKTPESLKFRSPPSEYDELEELMRVGDNLPNTVASLGAKLKRRALLVGVQYEGDRRFIQSQSELMLSTPTDVLMVYHMLLTRGYEPQNIRILVEGVMHNPLTHPRKQNIIDSLEWLFESADPGDYRYFHFSGHGYAYEVEEGQGKKAVPRPVASTLVVHPDSNSLTDNDESSRSAPGNRAKFYREALLTEWKYPPVEELVRMEMSGSLRLIEYTRISDEELNVMIAKLPKGCVLTVTLNCFHGGQMYDVHRRHTGPRWRGIGLPIAEPEVGRILTKPFGMYPNSSPRNLFVPPVFYLHSEFRYDPNVVMERTQGPDPLDGVQATVFVWSGYTTARTHARSFMSAFTSAVKDLEGDISHHMLFQEINRKVGEAPDEDGRPLIQLWATGDEKEEKAKISMNQQFVI